MWRQKVCLYASTFNFNLPITFEVLLLSFIWMCVPEHCYVQSVFWFHMMDSQFNIKLDKGPCFPIGNIQLSVVTGCATVQQQISPQATGGRTPVLIPVYYPPRHGAVTKGKWKLFWSWPCYLVSLSDGRLFEASYDYATHVLGCLLSQPMSSAMARNILCGRLYAKGGLWLRLFGIMA